MPEAVSDCMTYSDANIIAKATICTVITIVNQYKANKQEMHMTSHLQHRFCDMLTFP